MHADKITYMNLKEEDKKEEETQSQLPGFLNE